MATLVLQAAGQAVGGVLGPVGAVVGRAAGALAGNVIDQQLFGDDRTRTVGRIEDVSVQSSAEGNPIPRVHGRMRIAGTVIWARDFVEQADTVSTGKGGPQVREFSYTATFAVALCEGPIARIARVWADGQPLDTETVTMRVHHGGEDQAADPLIEAMEGVAPAYRGTAYVVFENLPVGPYGNRLPQLTFEVIRPVGDLEGKVRAVTLIPGATEFGYHPERVDRVIGPGEVDAENRHLPVAASDMEAALDELVAVCPNLERIALVVAWFADDLRAGHCTVRPCVEGRGRQTSVPWQVSGEDRSTARLVSADAEGRPNYGGTPADEAVVAAIRAIRARGLAVVFYPFLLMDVPEGNGLPDPYGAAEQAAFPWRGRITVTPDGDAAADAAVAAFAGTAAVTDFALQGTSVVYAGPEEWSLRRMILHYAHLCEAAGGVDAFLVGSELRGLTWVRGINGHPFVNALCTLADDVRGVLRSDTRISYAADWSEYFGFQPGGGDVTFHLDPFWARSSVDFVGIDNYWPLSDWRDGSHLDAEIAPSIHDHDYLLANVAGGEGYDWYYKNPADRVAQVRTPITDGAYGKPWVFRYKDLAAWWGSAHVDRVGGVEVAQPTDWVPGMKPVWFTETGCPAVDRGANQPNVFVDPKSAESALPHFSRGRRDDAMQRAYLTAMIAAFDPAHSPDIDRFNPQSPVYPGRMIDPATVHVWTYDARPWPAFPSRTDIWADGGNWARGHWVNGRLGAAPFDALIEALFADWGLEPPAIEGVPIVFDGHLSAAPRSLRDVIEPLLAATSAIGADTGTGVRIVGLDRPARAIVTPDALVEMDPGTPIVSETRAEAATLPVEMRLRHFDTGRAYQVASARFRRPEGSARQVAEIRISASLPSTLATELADIALGVAWGGRTVARFAVPPSRIALLPGDIVTLREGGRDRDLLVEEVEDLGRREVTARTIDRNALAPVPAGGSPTPTPRVPVNAPPVVVPLDLPRLSEDVAAHVPRIGVFARPFPDAMGVWRAPPGGTFTAPDARGTAGWRRRDRDVAAARPHEPVGLWRCGGRAPF